MSVCSIEYGSKHHCSQRLVPEIPVGPCSLICSLIQEEARLHPCRNKIAQETTTARARDTIHISPNHLYYCSHASPLQACNCAVNPITAAAHSRVHCDQRRCLGHMPVTVKGSVTPVFMEYMLHVEGTSAGLEMQVLCLSLAHT